MSSALYQNSAGISLLVAGEVVVERRARRHAGFFSSITTKRQAVDEADQIGPAGVERAGDAELADQQEIVVRRVLPIDDAQPLGLLAAVLAVGHRDRMPSLSSRRPRGSRLPGSSPNGRGSAHRRRLRWPRRQRRVELLSAARSRATSTTSPVVSRPRVPPAPKISSSADTVCQPSAANSPMAGCSTSCPRCRRADSSLRRPSPQSGRRVGEAAKDRGCGGGRRFSTGARASGAALALRVAPKGVQRAHTEVRPLFVRAPHS